MCLRPQNDLDHRQGRLHVHPLIPGPFLTQFEVGRDAVLAAKAQVGQYNAQAIVALDQWVEMLIMRVELAQSRSTTRPRSLSSQHSLMLTIRQPLSLPFLPTCCGLRPSRIGKNSSIV
jgi:hypothetical protein